MGHLGLTPQSIYKFGTYTVRAKEEEEAKQLKKDALLLEKLGCFAIVLEKVPAKLAEEVARSLQIPIIGIGAGSGVDDLEGYYIATGFSGHGFGMGAATGLIMSELVTGGKSRLDLEPFRLSRFTDGSKLELNAR